MATDPLKSTSWWHSLGVGQGHDEADPQTTAGADTDYADMGTAFGLDASMNPPSVPGDENTAPKDNAGRADPDAPRK